MFISPEQLLYGDGVTCDEAVAFLESDQLDTRLELVENNYCRQLIENLLSLDWEDRSTAKQLVQSEALCPAFLRE